MRDVSYTVIARRIARRVFEKRGSHSEVHLSEEELVALLVASGRLSREAGRIADREAELERLGHE